MTSVFRRVYRRVPSESHNTFGGSQQTLHGHEIEHIDRPEDAFSLHSRQYSQDIDLTEHNNESLLHDSPTSPLRKDEIATEIRPLPPRPSFRWANVDAPGSDVTLDRHGSNISTWIAGPRVKMWNPFWLRRSVLMTFVIVFALMALTVVLMYHFSVIGYGLSAERQSRHYAWTYGPTAVLTLVVMFWRQVDYSNRQLQPWKELQHGPKTADRTVLLDYISPMLPVILLKAFRHGHWAVLMSSIGMILLKLATIFSTGLLVLEPTFVTNTGVPFSLKTRFDASDYNISEITAIPGELFYGVQLQGLQYPLGTGPDLAVTTFESHLSSPGDTSYEAEVTGMQTNLDCEILNIANTSIQKQFLPWFSIQAPYFLVNISTPSCELKNIMVAQGADHGYHHQPDATQNFQGNFRNFTCSDGVDNSLATSMRPDNSKNPSYPEHRVLITMADLRWLPPDDPSAKSSLQTGVPTWWVQELTAVMCRPSYRLDTYLASFATHRNTSSNPIQATLTRNTTEKIEGFEDADIGPAVARSLKTLNLGAGGSDYVLIAVGTFFQFLAALNGNSRQEAFMDAQLLLEKSTLVFKGVMSQIAHQYLLKPADDVVVGSVSRLEDRLIVKLISTIFMAILFVMLCMIGIAELYLRPVDVVSHDPGSIASNLTVLAASPSFAKRIHGLGAARGSAIRHSLTSCLFQSRLSSGVERSFYIEPSFGTQNTVQEPRKQGSDLKWWHPIAAERWFTSIALILPLLIIAILEVLQHLSDKNHGIVDVSSDRGADSHVLMTYLPAFVMLSVAAIFTSINDTAGIFAPYSALRSSSASASSSIGMDLWRKIPAHALYLTAKAKNIAHSISIAAVFIAAFLTIVVSGLYSVTTVSSTSVVAVRQSDLFNFTQVDLSLIDNEAGAITSLIEYSNLSSPRWTHADFAFNAVKLPDDTTSTGVMSLKIPGLRAKLNCTALPQDSYTVVPELESLHASNLYKEGKIQIVVNTTMPMPCERMRTNATELDWLQYYYVPQDGTTAYIGKATLLSWYGKSVTVTGDGGFPAASGMTTGGYGCPTFAFSLGTASANSTYDSSANETTWDATATMSMVYCYQNLEEVETDVVLDLPDLSFNSSKLPTPDFSTSRLLENPTVNVSSKIFEFPVNNFLVTLYNTAGNMSLPAPNDGDPDANDVDTFIQTLVQGKDGVPMDELLGQANTDQFISSASSLYSTYMAQALSASMRNSTNLPNVTCTAELTTPNRLRLKQNQPPKIALQIMLGLLALSAIVIHLTSNMRKVLPHNPCSIAGVAVLLAGSNLCTRSVIPEGAEWRSDEELIKAGVFDGMLLRMGWRDDAVVEGGKSFGIDIERPNVVR